MKAWTVLFLTLVLGGGTRPVHPQAAVPAFVLAEADLFPEGIAFDPGRKTFFLSSVHKRKIVAISKDGRARDFIASGSGDFASGLGMKVDPARRELWALSVDSREGTYRSRVFVFGLETGRILRTYEPPGGQPHQLNDLVIAASGDAFLTDTKAGAVYRIPAGSRSMIPLVQSATEIPAPNGIAMAADGETLYVASDTKGIRRIEAGTGRILDLARPASVRTIGIDGLALAGTDLYAVVNDDPVLPEARIVRFELDAAGASILGVEILDRANPALDAPTTCLVAEGFLFVVANSQLRRLDQGRILPGPPLKEIVVLKYPLRRDG